MTDPVELVDGCCWSEPDFADRSWHWADDVCREAVLKIGMGVIRGEPVEFRIVDEFSPEYRALLEEQWRGRHDA